MNAVLHVLMPVSTQFKLYKFYKSSREVSKHTNRCNMCFFCLICHNRKYYENHMLQSRLHFRIHSALQEIKHRRKQAKEASKMEKKLAKRSKNGVNNNNLSADSDSISISLEGSSSLNRQNSNSSFETAPEYSSEDERDLGEITYSVKIILLQLFFKRVHFFVLNCTGWCRVRASLNLYKIEKCNCT